MSPSPAITFAAAFLATGLAAAGLRAQDAPVSPEPADSLPPGGAPSWSQVTPAISLNPTQKRSLVVAEDERNPYASRAPEIEIFTTDDPGETETDRIRQVLVSLPVTGRGYGPRGLKVLAGDIIFEVGRPVPQVLDDQTEILMVENVSESAVEIAWVDAETGQITGKRLKLTYDLSPKVNYVLKGQPRNPNGDDSKSAPKFATLRPHTEFSPDPVESLTAESEADGKSPDIAAEIRRQGQ